MAVKNRINVKSLILLLVLLCCQSMQAQSYIADVQKLSVEDGLSNRFVNKVYKDSRGFMWIATDYGLNRYDGYHFKYYTSENSALSSSIIRDVHEDDQHRLWVVEQGVPYMLNISILDLKTGTIQSFDEVFEGISPFTGKDHIHLYSGSGNSLWITTAEGKVYRYQNKRFEYIVTLPEKKSAYILYAGDRLLWIKTPSGEIRVNTKKGTLSEYNAQYNEAYTYMGHDKNSFWRFQPLEKKLLWFTGEEQDPQSIDLQPLDLPEAIFHPGADIARVFHSGTANELLWLYQRKNDSSYLFVLQHAKGTILDVKSKTKELYTHGQLYARSIYFEQDNRAWISTADGIFIITLKKNKFSTLLSDNAEGYSVRGITEDTLGILYINTINGRVRINTKTEKQKKYKTGEVLLGAHRDRQGYLWFAGGKNGIEKYNPLNGQSLHYNFQSNAKGYYASTQWAIVRDTIGKVWIGTSQGLYTLDPKTGRYEEFNHYNAFPQLHKSVIYYLFEEEKNIWIASSSGLYLLEFGKGITRRYSNEGKKPHYIPYNHILHFYRDKAGVFWLATKGGGLIRFNPEDGSYRQFTTTEGLPSNIVYAVYEDDYDKLWLPGNYGLVQFDKNTYHPNTYLRGDGIAHNEFNTISHYKAANGTLYFGGLDGLTVFHPEDFTNENTVPAPLRITNCKIVNGKTGALTDKTQSVSNGEKLMLSPSDKSFTVEFALLNYRNTQQNSYTYIIEGLDKKWTAIRENSLRINALPYGSYTLRIKGQSLKGEQSAGELIIPIIVIKPFYLQTWFLLCSVLVLSLIIYGIFRWRLQRLNQAKIRLQQTVRERTEEIQRQKDEIEKDKNTIEDQSEKLKELDRAKSRFFANISHELRTPLTLILSPLNRLITTLNNDRATHRKEITKPLLVMQRNGKKLLYLIEEILDLSKLEARKLEVKEQPVAFYSFVKQLFSGFESHASQRNIRYRLHYELPQAIILLLDTNKCEKIINNLLSNAFKYSPDNASIGLNITAKDTFIHIEIKDSGQGIHPDDLPHIFDRFYQSGRPDAKAEGGTGIGLALCNELATVMGGKLHVESQWGKGSTFMCSLPKKEVTVPIAITKENEEIPASPEVFNTEEATANITVDEHQGNIKEKHTILVVEDNDDMRNFIAEVLREHYRVHTAGNGEKALSMLKEEKVRPDLILSDVMMPRMDGFTLLKHIKSSPGWRSIPVILLTARAAQEDRLQGLTIGVDDYLTKPFDTPELLARIHNLLQNYQERKQWQKEKQTLNISFEEHPESWGTEWLRQAEGIVKREIVNYKYKVSDLAAEMHVSESQLLTKMKKITGLTPNQFIREIKLQKARSLLENKAKSTIAEVAYAVGFDTPEYFSKVYEKRFGKRPSAYFKDIG